MIKFLKDEVFNWVLIGILVGLFIYNSWSETTVESLDIRFLFLFIFLIFILSVVYSIGKKVGRLEATRERMKTKDTKEFFETLGEIWRDITSIEFLMRCALAQKEGDANKFPQPPYDKGKIYSEYPKSFSHTYFGDVAKEFNQNFPELAIPQELIDLRNAMAHGLIAEVNHRGMDEVVKFKKQEDHTLMIEFSMPLEQNRIRQIRKSLKELRQYIALEAADKPNDK